jgi:hypothetical protein
VPALSATTAIATTAMALRMLARTFISCSFEDGVRCVRGLAVTPCEHRVLRQGPRSDSGKASSAV